MAELDLGDIDVDKIFTGDLSKPIYHRRYVKMTKDIDTLACSTLSYGSVGWTSNATCSNDAVEVSSTRGYINPMCDCGGDATTKYYTFVIKKRKPAVITVKNYFRGTMVLRTDFIIFTPWYRRMLSIIHK